MDLQTKLNEEGMRMTRPRQVVLSILENANVPLSPQTIHQQSLDAQQEIGLVSVYRTLDILTDLALVRKVHTPDGCHGYVMASPATIITLSAANVTGPWNSAAAETFPV